MGRGFIPLILTQCHIRMQLNKGPFLEEKIIF